MSLENDGGRAAIVGYTGLVGSNLARQRRFDDFYNSKNIEEIANRHYDLLVCSGARGTKWIVNREPERDLAEITRLLDSLKNVSADFVILISTVDVYGIPNQVDEDTLIDPASQNSYGRHRYYIEQQLLEHFPRVLIVRLPALFGSGLQKNALYDLIHNHELEKIHPDSVYQFYWLEHTWRDIERAVAARLTAVNFATEPVGIREVAKEVFGVNLISGPLNIAMATYDFRTKHDHVFGGTHGYLRDRATVMREIRAFAEQERPGGGQ